MRGTLGHTGSLQKMSWEKPKRYRVDKPHPGPNINMCAVQCVHADRCIFGRKIGTKYALSWLDLWASYRWINAFSRGLALHTVTHIPSRRFPRTCNRRTLIEFLCRVTWPSLTIIRSSPWPVTSARDLSRTSGPSETGESASFLSFNKSSDFRSHRSASERSCRGRTALITEISFVWKSLSSSHKNSRKQTHEVNAGFETNIWIWSRGSSSRQDWTLACAIMKRPKRLKYCMANPWDSYLQTTLCSIFCYGFM